MSWITYATSMSKDKESSTKIGLEKLKALSAERDRMRAEREIETRDYSQLTCTPSDRGIQRY
jgi:hypothetical protein